MEIVAFMKNEDTFCIECIVVHDGRTGKQKLSEIHSTLEIQNTWKVNSVYNFSYKDGKSTLLL